MYVHNQWILLSRILHNNIDTLSLKYILAGFELRSSVPEADATPLSRAGSKKQNDFKRIS
jgi:hypothetical protein